MLLNLPFFLFFLVELFLLWTVKSWFMCSSVCHSLFLFHSTPPACGPSTWPTADPIPTTLLRSRPRWTPPSTHPVRQSLLHLPLLSSDMSLDLKWGKKTNVLSLAGWSKTSRRSSTHLIQTSGSAFSLNTHNPRLQDSSQVLGIHLKTRAWTDFYTPHVVWFFNFYFFFTYSTHEHTTTCTPKKALQCWGLQKCSQTNTENHWSLFYFVKYRAALSSRRCGRFRENALHTNTRGISCFLKRCFSQSALVKL